jgi:hypothetical protein
MRSKKLEIQILSDIPETTSREMAGRTKHIAVSISNSL